MTEIAITATRGTAADRYSMIAVFGAYLGQESAR